MNDINIDTLALKEKIEQLKLKRDKVKEILSNIETRMKASPDYWQSSTSESILEEFNLLYKEFSIINDSNNKYINFLENIVATDYTNKEDSLNKLIDSNI